MLEGCSFENSEIIIKNGTGKPMQIFNQSFDGSEFKNSAIYLHFIGCSFKGAVFDKTTLIGVFEDCDFTGATFRNSNLTCSFQGKNTFEGAKVRRCNGIIGLFKSKDKGIFKRVGAFTGNRSMIAISLLSAILYLMIF